VTTAASEDRLNAITGAIEMVDTRLGASTAPIDKEVSDAARMVHGVKVYGRGSTEVRALDDVTASFVQGRYTSIMGPSGSGKSTMMHCLAGLDDLTSGEVWLGTMELSQLSEKERTIVRREHIGFVFQSYNLVPTLTARENIELPQRLAGRHPEKAWFDEVVGRFGLGSRLDHKPSELSGGQQQRVAIARAIVAKPKIILADEPTGNLDSRSGIDVLTILREVVDLLGQTVVMVTHDPNAASFSDRVIFLADGHFVDDMDSPDVARILDQMKRLDR
jgi:putative ABC transport system ATP-binding protein